MLSENLIMRSGSLEKCDPVALTPNYEPIPSICYVTFFAPPPNPLETMHAVATARLLFRFGCIFENAANHACKSFLI